MIVGYLIARGACRVRTMKGFIAIAFTWLAFGAWAATPEEDVQRYMAALGDTLINTDKVVDELAWKGISDTRVYDVIEERLLDEAPDARRRHRGDRSRIGHYLRGLGYSGQEKYVSTISKFRDDRAYARYAAQALVDVKYYARWNPIISSRATFDPQFSDDVNRIRNMLRSDDRLLQRLGAKSVYFRNGRDPVLLDLVAEQLLAGYKQIPDKETADAVAWMVKTLGKSGDKKYVPVLKEVSQGVRDGQVSREVESWLRRMD